MSGSGVQLSDEEARKLLMSLDPRMLEQITQLQHQRLGDSRDQEHDDGVSGSGYGSSSGHLGLPGEDPTKICPSSPTLRKVSVGTMDVKDSGGMFRKKKSIPSLVMTFNAANKFASSVQESHETAAAHKHEPGHEEHLPATLAKSLQPPHHSPAGLLSVDSVMDRSGLINILLHKWWEEKKYFFF